MGLVVRGQTDGQSVELKRFHGLNVVSCEILSVRQQASLIRAYLPLSTIEHLPDLEEALKRFMGNDSIVIRYLNVIIGRLQNPRS